MSEKEIYYASLVERSDLTKPGSSKITKHLVLKIPDEVCFEVGDSVAIFPRNAPEEVERLMRHFPDTLVQDPKSKQWRTLSAHLREHANIMELSRPLFKAAKKELPEDKSLLKKTSVAEFLEESGVRLSAEQLVNALRPMLPRFYSIASSPNVHPGEIHLTVAYVEYDLEGKQRKGLATHYLCDHAPMDTPCIPVYIQPHRGFTIPEEDTVPMIMIGPGTGVAPFRAFIQERRHRGAMAGHWLIFGERTSTHDFFYEEDWQKEIDDGALDLDCAFSRDQETKIYVQHRIREKRQKLLEWLERGAYLYICGDAKRMAKDVERTLLEIFIEERGLTEEEALSEIKNLRSSGRYHKDIY